MKKQIRCGTDHGWRPTFRAASDNHVVVKTQRHAETIKAGAEIRCARRNANRNLLHGLAVELCTQGRSALQECSAPGPVDNRSVAPCRLATMRVEITAADEPETGME